MNITLESILKKAEVEADLSGDKRNYISLLTALEPYGYGSEQLNKLCAYTVGEYSFDVNERFVECVDYSLVIYPTYMYRVDGYYIYVRVADECDETQSEFYVENTSDAFLRGKIKMNKFCKRDFIEIAKAAKRFITTEYPEINIESYLIVGETSVHRFSTIEELMESNDDFTSYQSVLNSDS